MTTPIPVFCDYLTLTYSRDDSPVEEIKTDLLQCGATIVYDYGQNSLLALGKTGKIKIYPVASYRYAVAFSGSTLEHLRSIGRYESMLSLLSTSPHKVTRLDATYDVPIDSPPLLEKLVKKSPSGKANLTRKEVEMTQVWSVREDGKRTGTIYYGKGTKARVVAMVYDKAWEAWKKRRERLPPTTRYEITVSEGKATLKDAYNPTPIFWNFAAPVLLPLPKPAPEKWVEGGDHFWPAKHKPHEILPTDRLEKHMYKDRATTMALIDAIGAYGIETAVYKYAKMVGFKGQIQI